MGPTLKADDPAGATVPVEVQGEPASLPEPGLVPLAPVVTVGKADDPAESNADDMARSALAALRRSEQAVPQRTTPTGSRGVARIGLRRMLQPPPAIAGLAPAVARTAQDHLSTGAIPGVSPYLRRSGGASGNGATTEVDGHNRPIGAAGGPLPASESHTLAATKGRGIPLPDPVRRTMESAFGTDFGGVRVHADEDAARLNRSLESVAFTHGTDIYLANGAPDLSSGPNRYLLAHELAHVVQQGPAPQVRRLLRFTWRWGELTGWDGEVKKVKSDFESLRDSVDDIAAEYEDDAEWLAEQLDPIRKRMATLEAQEIPVDQRSNTLHEVASLILMADELRTNAEDRRQAAEKEREAEEERKAEKERKAKEEADRKAEQERKAEEERQAKEEAERKEAEERKAAEERAAQQEAERKAKEEADRKAEQERKAEEERKAKEEADRRAKEEADRKAKEEADRRQEEERKAQEEAERKEKERRKADRQHRETGVRSSLQDKPGTFEAADKSATASADREFEFKKAQLEKTKKEAEDASASGKGSAKRRQVTGRNKGRRNGGAGGNRASAQPTQTGPSPAEQQFNTGLKEAKQQRKDKRLSILEQLGAVASSAKAKALSDEDLAWIITNAHTSTDKATLLVDLAAPPGTMSLARSVAGRNDIMEFGELCRSLLSAGAPAEAVPAAATVLTGRQNSSFGKWLVSKAADPTFTSIVGLAQTTDSKALSLLPHVVPVLGTGGVANDFIKVVRARKATEDVRKTLLDRYPDDSFEKMLASFDYNEALKLGDFCQVLTPANLGRFTLGELLRAYEDNHMQFADLQRLLPLADDNCPGFVLLARQAETVENSEQHRLAAVRAESLLAKKAANFTVTVAQQDRPYGQHLDNPHRTHNVAIDQRTGFLSLNFPANAAVDIHVHWNARRAANPEAGDAPPGQITSMHVQIAGANGIELHQHVATFPLLVNAVVTALNDGPPTPTSAKELHLA